LRGHPAEVGDTQRARLLAKKDLRIVKDALQRIPDKEVGSSCSQPANRDFHAKTLADLPM
jgi:hypothetical protein